MSKFHRVKSYLSYWLNAINEHSLQSPFIYDLYRKVFKHINHNNSYDDIEKERHEFTLSTTQINVTDFGAGSLINKSTERALKQIATSGSSSRKYASLLSSLVNYCNATNILELGTSIGLSTLYLSVNDSAKVTTIEGSKHLIQIAQNVFKKHNRENINAITGNITEILPTYILNTKPLDFVFFDANHTKDATLFYFKECLKKSHHKSCFVFDDIHWSKDMEEAWELIKNDYHVTLSIDIYQMGIVFFNPELQKQHYILEY